MLCSLATTAVVSLFWLIPGTNPDPNAATDTPTEIVCSILAVFVVLSEQTSMGTYETPVFNTFNGQILFQDPTAIFGILTPFAQESLLASASTNITAIGFWAPLGSIQAAVGTCYVGVYSASSPTSSSLLASGSFTSSLAPVQDNSSAPAVDILQVSISPPVPVPANVTTNYYIAFFAPNLTLLTAPTTGQVMFLGNGGAVPANFMLPATINWVETGGNATTLPPGLAGREPAAFFIASVSFTEYPPFVIPLYEGPIVPATNPHPFVPNIVPPNGRAGVLVPSLMLATLLLLLLL